jgi:hypothetical protein
LIGPRIQAALGAVATLATIGLSQGSAQAYVVSVGGVQYDVTTFTGTYNDNTSNFQIGMMPWWGNQTAALEFASAVGTEAGTNWDGEIGAYFGYNQSTYETYNYVTSAHTHSSDSYLNGFTHDDWVWVDQDVLWAKATLASPSAAPAPGPLPILGAAAAFGASRKLRRRIKTIKVVASTATVV